MSDMTLIETIERFDEGMKKASSRARELAAAQKNNHWVQIADMLDGIRDKGMKIYRDKSMSRQDVLAMLDIRQKNMSIN